MKAEMINDMIKDTPIYPSTSKEIGTCFLLLGCVSQTPGFRVPSSNTVSALSQANNLSARYAQLNFIIRFDGEYGFEYCDSLSPIREIDQCITK
jgi:hypothetical protein